MKAKSGMAVAQPLSRIGEDAFVPVISSRKDTADVSLAVAPVPDKRYTGDVAWVVQSENGVTLLFGQRKLGGDLRSLLAVNMTFDSVHQLLESFELFRKSADVLKEKGLKAAKLKEIREEPAQTVALTASMIYVGFVGEDSCLDFYYASPFALQKAAALSKLAVDPVVRVNISTSLFFAVWDKLSEMASSMPSLDWKKK
jgi:hypothetical protein